METDDRSDLRAEIGRLLEAALESNRYSAAELARCGDLHMADLSRRDELHISEIHRRDVMHHDEVVRRQGRFDVELRMIHEALETRDLIGQAKGIIIGSMHCSSEEAFSVLKNQSQAENRKLHDVAADVVRHAQRRPDRPAQGT